MSPGISLSAALVAGTSMMAVTSSDATHRDHAARLPVEHPIVIGHRGASRYVPEHTLASYFIAIQQGADYIEPDLVMTKDRVLVARHENALASLNPDGSIRKATTPSSPSARPPRSSTAWRSRAGLPRNFTLAELKALRARERLPALRPCNARLDGGFQIPSFEEVLNLVDDINRRRKEEAHRQGRKAPAPIGVYPETKHPSYFDGLGLSMEEPLVALLHKHGYRGKEAPVFIQSFEVGNLKELSKMTRLPLIQLLDAIGRPFDFVLKGDPRTYADLAKPAGLREIAPYADGIGVNKSLIFPRDAQNRITAPTTLVQDAHVLDLLVHGWTFRAENAFLPANFTSPSGNPADLGDLAGEIQAFLEAGMDGFFTDQPDIGVRARDAFLGDR
jgi:glycerophosphoryl diester phosphodiesterase